MDWHITRTVLDQLRRWNYAQANVLELRMEDLSRTPEDGFSDIMRFTDFGIDDDVLASIMREHTFERESGGRRRGQEDRSHHFRKGVWGDWRNYFTDAHRNHFKELSTRRSSSCSATRPMIAGRGVRTTPRWDSNKTLPNGARPDRRSSNCTCGRSPSDPSPVWRLRRTPSSPVRRPRCASCK